jgi:hypothetical protein
MISGCVPLGIDTMPELRSDRHGRNAEKHACKFAGRTAMALLSSTIAQIMYGIAIYADDRVLTIIEHNSVLR